VQHTYERYETCPILANDRDLWPWVYGLFIMGAGDFLKNVGRAAQHADHENYPKLRPFLLEMKAKYPQYHTEKARV
jgi:hypothetical protein